MRGGRGLRLIAAAVALLLVVLCVGCQTIDQREWAAEADDVERCLNARDVGELTWPQLDSVLRAHVLWLRAWAGTVTEEEIPDE